jgi:HEAT repeat protein
MQFSSESDTLKRSQWPRCDDLANALAQRGVAATDALKAATTSRTHHVRSAALRALAKANLPEAKLVAQNLLADKAFEVRQTAAAILGVPIPP